MKARIAILIFLRLLIGGLFAFAGISKFLHMQMFISDVRNFHLLPPVLLIPFSLALIFLELTSGTALLLGLYTRTAALTVCMLSAIFLTAIGISLIRAIIIDCGCFGIFGSDVISAKLVIRNLLLLGASLTLGFHRTHPWSLDTLLSRRSLSTPTSGS